MIAIIDYGAGNLRSIRRAIEASGGEVEITDDPDLLASATAIVLPGVGNAGHAIERLESMGMAKAIKQEITAGKPFLGICVGMQLLFEHQEEGDAQGFGVIPGRVRSLQGDVKIPHMGWNRTTATSGNDAVYYYYVHSYVAEPDDPADVLATTEYGETIPSVVRRGNVWGTQFHPEKSGEDGLAFVRQWMASIEPDMTGAAP